MPAEKNRPIGPAERKSLEEAQELMSRALECLDSAAAPALIGAQLELAIQLLSHHLKT